MFVSKIAAGNFFLLTIRCFTAICMAGIVLRSNHLFQCVDTALQMPSKTNHQHVLLCFLIYMSLVIEKTIFTSVLKTIPLHRRHFTFFSIVH